MSKIIGIDNDMRSYFFGKSASVRKNISFIKSHFKNYHHYEIDIRNYKKLQEVFKKYNNKISFIIHSAAQPSHDWAAKEPLVDYAINSTGTFPSKTSQRPGAAHLICEVLLCGYFLARRVQEIREQYNCAVLLVLYWSKKPRVDSRSQLNGVISNCGE